MLPPVVVWLCVVVAWCHAHAVHGEELVPLPQSLVVENDVMSFHLELVGGFTLRQIQDRRTGTTFLHEETADRGPLGLQIWPENRIVYRNFGPRDLVVTRVDATRTPSGVRTEIGLEVDVPKLEFRVVITLPDDSTFSEWQVFAKNGADEPVGLGLLFPNLPVRIDGERPTWGMVPIELGVSGPLDHTLGAPMNVMNALQFGVVGQAPDEPSLAVINLAQGAVDLHLTVEGDGRLHGRLARTPILPGEARLLGHLLVGIVGHWQEAAKVYRQVHADTRAAEAPEWLRRAGAVYGFSGGGGGAIYLRYPAQELPQRIPSFTELPQLLAEAQQFGTNVLYLWDYWEGATEGGRPAYWNKGDYIPRTDLGGEVAFKQGIAAVHARGGRVILYVEPFITFRYSKIGSERGYEWALIDPTGRSMEHYPDNWSMCPNVKEWQDHVIAVATRLVGEYGADGIFLDSYGMQWNMACHDSTHGHEATEVAYNEGVITLARRVREAVRAIKPDAVVMTESFNETLAATVDGSLDGSFYWHWPLNAGLLEESPWKAVHPQYLVFSNGNDLNELHQVFAAGQSLALAPNWLPSAGHIKKLLEIRRILGDALIDGRLVANPRAGSGVVAYHYAGSENEVVIVAIARGLTWTGDVHLGSAYDGTAWEEMLTGSEVVASETGVVALDLGLDKPKLAILRRAMAE